MSELPAVRFLRALCAAVLRDEPPADAAARAHAALRELWGSQRSLVLEVQFTGFVAKGERLGGVEPAFLRAAGQLIVSRVNRLGFTPDADAADIAALFEIVSRPPAELGEGGVVGAVRAAAPSGIYAGTSTGETYKPAPRPAADASVPADAGASGNDASPPAPAASTGMPAPADTAAGGRTRADSAASAGLSAPVDAAAPRGVPADPAASAGTSAPADAAASAGTSMPVHAAASRGTGTGGDGAAAGPPPLDAAAADATRTPGEANAADKTPAAAAQRDAPAPGPAGSLDVAPDTPPGREADARVETPPPAAPSSPAPPLWGSGVGVDLGDDSELSAFEFVEDVADLTSPPAASPPPSAPAEARADEPAANDMYHFFRASSSGRGDEESAALPGLLHATDNMSRYDDLAQSCARNALRHLRAGDHLQAVDLLEALAVEAERTDRTRLFRESAAQALRSAGTSENLPHVIDLLQFVGNERERVLHVLFFLGGEAVTLLENHLFRTPDPEVRRAIFRRLVRGEGGGRPTVARALADSPVRARVILELVTIPEVDPEQSVRWTADAAASADVSVRTDAARVAAQLGGRGGLRVLVDLLADADRGVRRAALHGLASMQDPASVPFLTRFLNDNADDDLQLAAVAALGRTGSADALPPLLAIVNKRSLFGGRKAKSLKLAAIEAIGLTGVPAARDVLASVSSGSDSDLAAEARRTLASLT